LADAGRSAAHGHATSSRPERNESLVGADDDRRAVRPGGAAPPLGHQLADSDPGDQERDGEDDAEVEHVDQAVERISGAIGVRLGATADDGHRAGSRATWLTVSSLAVTNSTIERSCAYMRSRTSEMPKASIPISSPTTVTLKATRS